MKNEERTMHTDFNKVFVGGRLAEDPQLIDAPNGQKVCKFVLFSKRSWLSENEPREETNFFECVAWGKTAEGIGRHMLKGTPVIVEGRLKQESWSDRSGSSRKRVVLVVNAYQNLTRSDERPECAGRAVAVPCFE